MVCAPAQADQTGPAPAVAAEAAMVEKERAGVATAMGGEKEAVAAPAVPAATADGEKKASVGKEREKGQEIVAAVGQGSRRG